MLCENCKKNPATTYFKQTVNGSTREVFLCSECASKLGLSDSAFGLGNFGFGNFGFGPGFARLADALGQTATRSCPTCGATLQSVRESGTVGCADCYEAFRETLRQWIPRVAGNKVHVGSVPNSAKSAADDIASLKEKLAQAVRTENFEEATVLRDRIRELERANTENKAESDGSNE